MAHLSNVDPWFVWWRPFSVSTDKKDQTWANVDTRLPSIGYFNPFFLKIQHVYYFVQEKRTLEFVLCLHPQIKFVTEIHRCLLVQFPTLLSQICLSEMIIWLVVSTPLKKIYESQLGLLFQTEWKSHKIPWFQSPPTSYVSTFTSIFHRVFKAFQRLIPSFWSPKWMEKAPCIKFTDI